MTSTAAAPTGTHPDARGWGDPFDPTGEAAALAAMAPDARLLEALEGLDVGAATDTVVLEAIAAWERVKAHADAALSRLSVVFVDRVAADPLLPASQALRHAEAEIACRLAISAAAAGRRLDTAFGLDKHPGLADALHAGRIDTGKARLLLHETSHLPRHRAAALIEHLLPDAAELTPTQLRDKTRKLLLEADPDTAATRHTKARSQRTLWREAAPDGMALLHVLDTATNIEAAYTAIAVLAGSPASDDPRSAGARRTDTLITLLTGRRPAPAGAAGPAEPAGGHETVPDPRSTLAGVLDRLPACAVHLDVTVGAGTLLGLDDRPGHLAGYGPIPADLARQVAQDATWRQILTCPDTGEFLHRAATTYRPGLVLAATVRTRDVTCTFPGCQRPAAACDLDHIEPFDPTRPPAGQTCTHNLHPLCRHHHLIKTHGRWTVTRDEHTGTTRWTSPTRHQYTRPPAVLAGHPPPALPDLGPPEPEEIDDTPLFADDIDEDGWVPKPSPRSERLSVPFDSPGDGPGAPARARATGRTAALGPRTLDPDERCAGPPPF